MSDIDSSFYKGLKQFLYTGGNREEQYSNNYFGRIVKVVKFVYVDAKRNGVHFLPDLQGFVVEDHTADTIYLTLEELDRIWQLDLKSETKKLVRGKFLLGAYTGLRVSDFNNLNKIDISDRFITVTTRKTGQKIIAPINSRVKEILNTIDVTKPINDQKINLYMKEIARDAGINEQVKVTKYIGGKRIGQAYEKWELVRSHTARRSFATNSYKAGVPTLAIMKITGHTTEKSFLRYIKISEEENAEMLLKHPFFQ